MDELIANLVPPAQQAAAQALLDDPGSRLLIRQQLSHLAEDNAGLLPQSSFNWILCKLSTFGAEESDTVRMGVVLRDCCCLKNDNQLIFGRIPALNRTIIYYDYD